MAWSAGKPRAGRRSEAMRKFWLVFALGVAVAGCAGVPSLALRQQSVDASIASCERALELMDAAIDRAGVRDAADARIPGLLYLRANRFAASFAGDTLNAAQFAQWVDAMEELALAARDAELANLPAPELDALAAGLAALGFPARPASDSAKDCSRRLKAHDMSDDEVRAGIQAAVRVPDAYDYWMRVVGLYPLTTIPFHWGIQRWLRETVEVFNRPLAELAVRGRLVRYAPAPGPSPLTREQVADLIARATRNPLGIPEFDAAESAALAATFAPEFEIDEIDENDRIGQPAIGADGAPQVEPAASIAFAGISYARIGGEVLPQLTYTVWFKSRPKSGRFDLLGGKIDGLVWRVTVASDGRPLLYDSIHPCGCYHLFFPTPRLALRDQPASAEEPALVPQRLPQTEPSDRIVLRIAPGTHYIERVLVHAPGRGAAVPYAIAGQNRLRKLPFGAGGTRSFYDPEGFVRGSERAERVLFWPMGVPRAGAMRQWGRQATAFIGTRHFDDPRLMERYFLRVIP